MAIMIEKNVIGEPVSWYLSREIVYFEFTDQADQDEYQVWENLILINAQNPEEAYQKALKHGFGNEEDVTIDGRKGRCKFKGLKTLVAVYENIEDGAEIEWQEYMVEKDELESLVKPKEKLPAFRPPAYLQKQEG
jgi:Domain of unknown function (DUF4288)